VWGTTGGRPPSFSALTCMSSAVSLRRDPEISTRSRRKLDFLGDFFAHDLRCVANLVTNLRKDVADLDSGTAIGVSTPAVPCK